MMNYKPNGTDQARIVILARAMDLLGQVRPKGVTLPELVEFIDDEDPTLVNAIGKLDTKHFARLVQDLETIRCTTRPAFGTGRAPGRRGARGWDRMPGRARHG